MSGTSTGWRLPRNTAGFLVDRCLTPRLARGVNYLGQARRHVASGAQAAHLEDIYPGRAEDLTDTEWLRDVGLNEWSALTQDAAILFSDAEYDAIILHSTRVFSLASANLTNEGKGLMFGRWWLPIVRRTTKPGPCFWRLHPDRIQRDIA